MLDAFRTHKRWLMFIAMVLIIPSFIVTGIYSYNRLRQADDAIAKIGEVSITPQMFDQQKRQQLEELRNTLGDSFKASMLDNKEGRQAIVDQLANQVAIEQAVQQNHINIGEADAVAVIKATPSFQENGKFVPARYEQFLRSRATSDQQFVMQVRGDLARQTLTNGVLASSIVPEDIVKSLHYALTVKSDIRTRTFNEAQYASQTNVTDADVKKYYDEHTQAFQAPEEVSIQYLVLSPDDIKVTTKPNEDEMRTYYEQNKNRWGVPEERRASHILLAFDPNKKDVEATRKKAEEVLAKVKADPDNFAKYAKEYSQDPGSAQEGGDLDFFGRGMMVAPFENAVFSAKKDEIVGPVETEYGFHIIKVTDIRPSTVRPYEAVRGEIEKQYQSQEAVREFAQKAEDFTNMSYEQPDSLDPIAEKFGLKVQTADGITRDGATNPALRTLITEHVIEALFSDESLKDKHNTSAIEVRPNVLVTARVTKHLPKRVLPLDDVKDEIQAHLQREAASKLTAAAGEKLLADLKANPQQSLDGFTEKATVSMQAPGKFPREVILRVASVPAKGLPAFTGIALGDGSYMVIQVLSHEVTEPKPAELTSIRNELSQLYGRTEVVTYLNALRQSLGEKILRPAFIEGDETNSDEN